MHTFAAAERSCACSLCLTNKLVLLSWQALDRNAKQAKCSVLELVLNEHFDAWQEAELKRRHQKQHGKDSVACQLIENVHELLAIIEYVWAKGQRGAELKEVALDSTTGAVPAVVLDSCPCNE